MTSFIELLACKDNMNSIITACQANKPEPHLPIKLGLPVMQKKQSINFINYYRLRMEGLCLNLYSNFQHSNIFA